MTAWEPEERIAGLLADATAALDDSRQDTSAAGLVTTIGLRDVVERLERLRVGRAYEVGVSEGTVKGMRR